MFKYFHRIIFFVLVSFQSLAFAETSENALNELVTALNKINTLSGSFIQYSIDQRGARIQNSKGELKAERGGKFYWHTFEPLEQVVVSNGTEVTVYDPDLEQATIQAVGSQATTTPAILFSGDTQKIGQLFDVSLSTFQSELRQFQLIPKDDEGLFEQLQLNFSGANVSELRITDSLGQRSTMSFIQTQVNLEFPEGTFEANLPPGTDIIRDIPAP